MTTPMTHDGNDVRPMDADELAAYEAACASAEKTQQDAEAAAAARQSARLKLSALGLSDDEIAALIP